MQWIQVSEELALMLFQFSQLVFLIKTANLEELTKKVEDNLIPGIEAIDGVSSAAISGQQIEEVSLNFRS